MANEKLVTRETAKEVVSGYTQKLENGLVIPSKSLTANEINAISDESGDTQETPFINQGTGTANGTSSVDTGTVGKHIQKQGAVYGVNQLVENGDFANGTTGWSKNSSATFVATNNVLTLTCGETTGNRIYQQLSTISGHKCLISAYVKPSSNMNVAIELSSYNYLSLNGQSCNANQWSFIYLFVDINITNPYICIGSRESLDNTKSINVKNVMCIDLTQWFNGNIPQDLLDHPEHWGWYQNYGNYIAYNTGTLVDSNGRYLECGGRNLFDKSSVTSNKRIKNDGTIESASGFSYSDYIEVCPSTTYYVKNIAVNSFYQVMFAYDKDKNYIGVVYDANNGNTQRTRTTPSNARYIRINIINTDIDTQVLSLYYAGEDYSQYYLYEQPKVYDTGSEQLLSTGVKLNIGGEREDVYDYKEPSGLITRRVGVVNLGSLEWDNQYESSGRFSVLDFASNFNAKNSGGDVIAKIICSKYQADTTNNIFNQLVDKSIGVSSKLWVRDTGFTSASAFKTAMNGVYLYYELATPTTEEGTPFSENIEINDFGTMGWYSAYTDSNTNTLASVPQGCKIFYPAWYVGFIDTLGQRADIDWNANNVVSQTELGVVDTKHDNLYAIMQENVGGALRHILVATKTAIGGGSIDFDNTSWVDLGSLTWTQNSYGFYATLNAAANILVCSKYKQHGTASNASGVQSQDKVVCFNYLQTSGYFPISTLIVRDTTYSSYTATQFKNAMKGVLLAYEKAS